MMIQTTVGVPMDATMLNNYFRALVNLFFKILPIKESGESSLEVYMRSLQAELLGCKVLILLWTGWIGTCIDSIESLASKA